MTLGDKQQFAALRQAVEARFREGHPHCHVPISEWKGQWIVDFQEDLLAKVQGRVSEKWFYTYFRKKEVRKLPRIDMLNLLSRYAGYQNWADLCNQVALPEVVTAEGVQARTDPYPGPTSQRSGGAASQVAVSRELVERESVRQVEQEDISESQSTKEGTGVSARSAPSERATPSRRINLNNWVAVICVLGIAATAAYAFWGSTDPQEAYELEFVDAFTQSTLQHAPQVQVLSPEGHWQEVQPEEGKLTLKGRPGVEERIALSGAYCRAETLTLTYPDRPAPLSLKVKPDDFAIMIHIFANSEVGDWQSRRDKLDHMLAENAEIFQVDPEEQLGMEMYNKAEFINKLTMPVQGLRNLEILETKYNDQGRISGLRFIQKPTP